MKHNYFNVFEPENKLRNLLIWINPEVPSLMMSKMT